MCGREPPPRTALENRQAVNRSVAFFIPLLLAGLVGYATWVVVVLVCVRYLIDSSYNTLPRQGPAIAIIVLYFIFLFPMAVAYFRTIHIVLTRPGYTDLGQPCPGTITKFIEEEPPIRVQDLCGAKASTPKEAKTHDTKDGKAREKKQPAPKGHNISTLDHEAIFRGDVPPPPGTERFYTRDVFQCDPSGLPIWCGTCCNWKPDRAHHCSDIGRCVINLDHFCPWVGGVVAENNIKFFIQFNFFATLYTFFVLVVMAVYVSQTRSLPTDSTKVHWYVILGLSALFFLFTGGMLATSIKNMLQNLTTVDALDHQHRTLFLAIRTNARSQDPGPPSETSFETRRSTHRSNPMAPKTRRPSRPRPIPWQGTITYPLNTKPTPPTTSSNTQPSESQPQTTPPHTFAIVCTRPGTNPWHLGALANARTIMGDKWYDWLLPIRRSPGCKHDRYDSFYPMGPELDRLKIDAGIEPTEESSSGSMSHSSHRKRRRRSRTRRMSAGSEESMGSTLANVNGARGEGGELGEVSADGEVLLNGRTGLGEQDGARGGRV